MAVVSRPPADDREAPESPSSWIMPVLTLATFVAMLNAMALGPFLPVIADDLNTSVALLGQIPALSMLLAAFLGLVVGPLADQVGHRRTLLGGLLIAAVSSIGLGLAPSYIFLLIAALVGAGSRAVVQPIAFVIAGTAFRGDQQRRAISWASAGVTGAVIVGIPALATIAEMLGWRVAFAALAGLTAVLLVLAYRSIAPDGARTAPRPSIGALLDSYRPLVEHRPTLGLIGATLVGAVGVWLMATYLGAYYSERHGYSIQQIGWVYLVPGVTLFVGSLAVGGRLGTLPLRPLVVVSRVGAGLAIGGLFILPLSPLAGMGLLFVQGATTGISTVAITLLLTKESPAGQATTMTLNIAALSLGTATGSSLGGLLLAVSGFWLVGLCALLLSFASAGLVWWSQERTIYVVPIPSPKPPV